MSDEELDEFTCGICQDLFMDPMETQCCRQIYCKQCITQWLNERNSCPFDRKSLDMRDMKSPSRVVTNLLNKMKVKCEYHCNGCDVISIMDQLSNHSKACVKNPNMFCQKCGLSGGSAEDHNCIANLLMKISEISDENKILKAQNNLNDDQGALKVITFSLNKLLTRLFQLLNDAVKRARNNLSKVKIIINYKFAQKDVDYCIEKVRECIKETESARDISTRMYQNITKNYPRRSIHVSVRMAGMGYSCTWIESSCLHLRFDRLDVVIFISPEERF